MATRQLHQHSITGNWNLGHFLVYTVDSARDKVYGNCILLSNTIIHLQVYLLSLKAASNRDYLDIIRCSNMPHDSHSCCLHLFCLDAKNQGRKLQISICSSTAQEKESLSNMAARKYIYRSEGTFT